MAKIRTRRRGQTYSYSFEAGKTDTGGRRRIEKGGFATEKEAYNAGIEALNSFLHGNIAMASSRIPLASFMESWLNDIKPMQVKSSTLANYKNFARKYIVPYLGSTALQDLTPAMIDIWLNNLTKMNLSYNTLHTALAILKSCLAYATYPAEVIDKNPAMRANIPKKAKKSVVERKIISPEMLHDLLEKCRYDMSLKIPILLMYHTGMRIGEVCGLTWDHVDLDKGIISVVQQMYPNATTHRPQLVAPKTQSSFRDIYIDDQLIEVLSSWKMEQFDRFLAGKYVMNYADAERNIYSQSPALPCPKNCQPVDLVCTTRKGTSTHRSVIQEFLQKNGLNAHSFRHTHATMLIEAGAVPKAVSTRLGHSKTAITQDLYTHKTDSMQKDVSELFASLLKS